MWNIDLVSAVVFLQQILRIIFVTTEFTEDIELSGINAISVVIFLPQSVRRTQSYEQI